MTLNFKSNHDSSGPRKKRGAQEASLLGGSQPEGGMAGSEGGAPSGGESPHSGGGATRPGEAMAPSQGKTPQADPWKVAENKVSYGQSSMAMGSRSESVTLTKPKGVKGEWSEPARRVLEERYLMKRDGQLLETPDEMCWRVASDIARAEAAWSVPPEAVQEIATSFYKMMVKKQFIPNSPTLMNAGKKNGLQYSACYVLPVGDSMLEIFDAIKKAAVIHQSGGGTGFAFSRLRPKNALVHRSLGKASGPISFMRVFDAATEAVKQGGKRRGANMGILRVDHPDIMEFIECKLKGGITNFNISVAATDPFMKAVEEDREYELVAPHSGEVTGKLKAREVFQKIVEAAWQTGDPGMIFIDRVNAGRANPVPEMGPVEATNPCGEQPLYPNEACNLGSLNLAAFVKDHEGQRVLDWGELEKTTRLTIRFLDDVIDVNPYPLPEIDDVVKQNRRIGLGVMGWADLLFLLGIRYMSQEALDLAERIMRFITEIGHDESANLAQVRAPFPNWENSIYKNETPLRNSTVTTIAPTGSISIIADCSSGIEPIFALAFTHKVEERKLEFLNPILVQELKRYGVWSEQLHQEILKEGTLEKIQGIPDSVRKVYVSAHEVTPEWHVRTQAAFQKYTDNAVSKTINLPQSASPDDVKDAYLLAYKLGCLGITIFRDGCKDGQQVLYKGVKEGNAPPAAPSGSSAVASPPEAAPPGIGTSPSSGIKPRPKLLNGITYREKTPTGTSYITLNKDEAGELFEVFVNVGKAGSDVTADSEALGRLVSLLLRIPSAWSATVRVREVVNQLKDIGGRRDAGFGKDRVRSVPDAIARVLAQHIGEPLTNGVEDHSLQAPGDLCPECGIASLVFEEGCSKCHSCGYSNC